MIKKTRVLLFPEDNFEFGVELKIKVKISRSFEVTRGRKSRKKVKSHKNELVPQHEAHKFIERSERSKGSWSTYNLERSERLKGAWSTYKLERSERLEGSWSTYNVEPSEGLRVPGQPKGSSEARG